jgi:hypothetical protein
MCIALPIQDKFNYDLFFADHIHHFNHKNFLILLENTGFKTIKFELGRDSYSNIGMYFCKKQQIVIKDFLYLKNKNIMYIDIILKNISDITKKYSVCKLYAFGYGEIAKTILPYSNLDKYIIKYIDDFSNDTKVIGIEEAKKIFETKIKINIVLLVNPQHTNIIQNIFKENNNISFISIFGKIDASI